MSQIHHQFTKKLIAEKEQQQQQKQRKGITIAESYTGLIGIDVIQNTFISNLTLRRQADQATYIRLRRRSR